MYEHYLANDEDIKAIEDGINFVWHPKLNFIFTNKKLIENVTIISFDSCHFYIWENYNSKVNRIPHKINIPDEYQLGWRCGFGLEKLIPLDSLIKSPKKNVVISGSLLKPFIGTQKQRNRKLNPYITSEGYLATIVHEYGHIYFDRHFSNWYSNKDETINLLESALNLYQNKRGAEIRNINIPNFAERNIILSETFAFCSDYSAASIFWPEHKKDIDMSNSTYIKELIVLEEKLDLLKTDSCLHPKAGAHNSAATIGKILINAHPNSWPEILLSANYLTI